MGISRYLILSAIFLHTLSPLLFGQTPFEFNLNKFQGNRIVLLGSWTSSDTAEWKQTINSGDLYDYGFVLLNRINFLNLNPGISQRFGIQAKDIGAFETWVRQLYGLDSRATWLALDMESKLIATGDQIPDSKEFEQLLRQKGYRTPLRIVRDFLRENPDHIDAKTDLLKEVRRRALLHEPITTNEDLDEMQDLKKWGVLANETNNVFNGSWLGIEIDFFRPEQDQPERFSPLMRAAFRRNIPSVEAAIRVQPTNSRLWNIWAWMARSIPDYRWAVFVNSLESAIFWDVSNVPTSCPSAEVSIWLIEDAAANKDWDTVVKYAVQATGFVTRSNNEFVNEWMPGGGGNAHVSSLAIQNYPGKSYALHLEALLRLGRVEDANDLFDRMIRLEGSTGMAPYRSASNNALMAANAARAAGLEEIASIWEQGEQINKVPYTTPFFYIGSPQFCLLGGFSSDYFKEFSELTNKLNMGMYEDASPRAKGATLGWREEDGNRWGLIGADGRLLHEDTSIPSVDEMRSILAKHGIESISDQYRNYISKQGSVPDVELMLARENIHILGGTFSKGLSYAALNNDQIEKLWSETTRLLKKIASDHPEVLASYFWGIYFSDPMLNSAMETLSRQYLTVIESLLEKKPSHSALWHHWFFWNKIEGNERSIEPLMERIKPSPITKAGTVPPASVINSYYEECKKNGNWPKVVELLKQVWDREFSKITGIGNAASEIKLPNPSLGDRVGMPLIEAYLNDNKPNDANDIFNAWLNCGGKFANISKIVELAKEKGRDRLAREWEDKVKK